MVTFFRDICIKSLICCLVTPIRLHKFWTWSVLILYSIVSFRLWYLCTIYYNQYGCFPSLTYKLPWICNRSASLPLLIPYFSLEILKLVKNINRYKTSCWRQLIQRGHLRACAMCLSVFPFPQIKAANRISWSDKRRNHLVLVPRSLSPPPLQKLPLGDLFDLILNAWPCFQ